MTDWLRSQTNELILVIVPKHGNEMFKALGAVGGLNLAPVYDNLDDLIAEILRSKRACGPDNRLFLGAEAHYQFEKRPASGSGSASSKDWMYCIGGEVLA